MAARSRVFFFMELSPFWNKNSGYLVMREASSSKP